MHKGGNHLEDIATLAVAVVASVAWGGDEWSDTDKDYLHETESADDYALLIYRAGPAHPGGRRTIPSRPSGGNGGSGPPRAARRGSPGSCAWGVCLCGRQAPGPASRLATRRLGATFR